MPNLKKIFFLFNRKEKKKIFFLLFLILIVSILDVLGVASILPFIAVLANPGIVESNQLLSFLFQNSNFFGVETLSQFLIFLGFTVFFLLIISLLARALVSFVLVDFAFSKEYSISKKFIEGYLHQPYEWFLNKNSSQIGKNLLSEINLVIQENIIPTMNLFTQSLVILGLVVLLIFVDPFLAFLASGVFLMSYIFIFLLVKKRLDLYGIERLKANSQRFSSVSETFSSVKEIKTGELENVCINFFSKSAKQYAKNSVKATAIGLLPRYLLEAIAFGGMLITILFLMITNGDFKNVVPIISLYAFAGYRLMPALQLVYNAFTKIKFSNPALNNLYFDLQNLKKYENSEKTKNDFKLKKEIYLNKINYNYPNTKISTLNNINLKIPVASKIGIVGPTGSGKTTLLDIILGLLKPTSGEVILDDQDLNLKNLQLWHNSIGYIPQSIFLSDTTIAKNIAFGVHEDEIDNELLEESAKIAQIHDFIINELPLGYETTVGERGIRLSGGQKQRIGIARAFYKKPKVLVFDEATSALDNLTEELIINSLNKLEKITVLFVTHRLRTIKNCDLIVYLDKGAIIDIGNYSQLMTKNPNFFKN